MHGKRIFKMFNVNIDTITASTHAKILINKRELKKYGWTFRPAFLKKVESYVKIRNHMRYEYFPIRGYLSITFSAPKIMSGSNTRLFDFSKINLFFIKMDALINSVLDGVFTVPSFRKWNGSRLDINVDIPFKNQIHKLIYLRNYRKIRILKNKRNYDTGVQHKNKSMCTSVYDKEKQIIDLNPCKVTDEDIFFLKNASSTPLRLEFQLKKNSLRNIYDSNRSMETLLTQKNINFLYHRYMKKFKLQYKILIREMLFKSIDNNFSRTKARNMKLLIHDLNELSTYEFDQKHKKSTKRSYETCLNQLELSIYYFDEMPDEIVDFTNMTVCPVEPKLLTINEVTKKVVELILKLILAKNIQYFTIFKDLKNIKVKTSYPDRGS